MFSPTESGSVGVAIGAVLNEASVTPSGDSAAGSPYAMATVAARLGEIYRETIAATSGRLGVDAKTPVAGHSMHVRGHR